MFSSFFTYLTIVVLTALASVMASSAIAEHYSCKLLVVFSPFWCVDVCMSRIIQSIGILAGTKDPLPTMQVCVHAPVSS